MVQVSWRFLQSFGIAHYLYGLGHDRYLNAFGQRAEKLKHAKAVLFHFRIKSRPFIGQNRSNRYQPTPAKPFYEQADDFTIFAE